MTRKYVSPEMAKLLKEKGFMKECLCYYIGEDLVYNVESPIANNQLWFCHNEFDNIWHRDNVDAPTIADVLEWLVEDKNIFVEVHAHATMATISKMAYFCYVRHGSNGADIFLAEPATESFGRCKDAYLAGIDYAIKNLI